MWNVLISIYHLSNLHIYVIQDIYLTIQENMEAVDYGAHTKKNTTLTDTSVKDGTIWSSQTITVIDWNMLMSLN